MEFPTAFRRFFDNLHVAGTAAFEVSHFREVMADHVIEIQAILEQTAQMVILAICDVVFVRSEISGKLFQRDAPLLVRRDRVLGGVDGIGKVEDIQRF